ncbi:MAG: PSD1 and planctomycete cytochrome C domain-containing protein [Bacteroidota bacterium]
MKLSFLTDFYLRGRVVIYLTFSILCSCLFIVFSCNSSNNLVDFNKDVRPILNKNCLSCHGGVKQLGELSFLFKEEAFQLTESNVYAIIPGNAKESELIKRIKHDDPELQMPPEQDRLSEEDISTLEKWVDQGAKWDTHWAYRLPQLPAIPTVKSLNHFPIQNPIDQFAFQKMQEKGLSPSERTSKATLLRRVSLDLIGLPPSLQELENFLADESENAYEKVVDRLLTSPRFGEHWASMWMDLARYGDSQGYQKDPYRSIWIYRDWLIKSFNDDLPFDQFTIEQLAGDLLPAPKESQLIATAFHRNTMTNDEGGTDDEEFRVAAVLDRVNTTWEVWQATTMSCVQCHSHPYDPFKHEEYYTSYAFFNNTADSDKRDDRPYILTYPLKDKAKLAHLTASLEGVPKIQETLESDAIDSIRTLINQAPSTPKIQALKDTLESFKKVRTPVFQELEDENARKSHLFERGNWLVHGKEVQANIPNSLNINNNEPTDRLALAEWLVSDKNPLTARVTVNRFWAQIFGKGIVKTVEDFGTQSAPPTHPELLDWLALHFKNDLDWSVKKLLRTIVLSSTYQQSSAIRESQLELDPHNDYLARASRVRLSAEQIRDQALAVSGLLSSKMYGPSVMPPQPDGIWQVIRNVLRWEESEAEDRYRRALYTFWRRSSPYPAFLTFDSPTKELCVSRRIRTNTPLQALTTLNDTVYVEAARALAVKMYDYKEGSVEEKIAFGYQQAILQVADEKTLNILVGEYARQIEYYQVQPTLAEKMALQNKTNAPQLAALSVVANVILNLDAFLVKE